MPILNDGTYDTIEETIFESARTPMSGHPYYMPYFLYKNYEDFKKGNKGIDIQAQIKFRESIKNAGTSLYVHPKKGIKARIIIFLLRIITQVK